MSRLLVLTSLPFWVLSGSVQSAPGARAEPTRLAACVLEAFTREGYRVHANPADSTRRLLSRTLTGVDPRSGQPNVADSYTENVTVRLDAGVPGLTIDQIGILRPTTDGASLAHAAATARLDRATRALLIEATVRCSR